MRPILPVTEHPPLREVYVFPINSKQADFGINEDGRKDIKINVEMYRSSLEECRTIIQKYNETVDTKKAPN